MVVEFATFYEEVDVYCFEKKSCRLFFIIIVGASNTPFFFESLQIRNAAMVVKCNVDIIISIAKNALSNFGISGDAIFLFKVGFLCLWLESHGLSKNDREFLRN